MVGILKKISLGAAFAVAAWFGVGEDVQASTFINGVLTASGTQHYVSSSGAPGEYDNSHRPGYEAGAWGLDPGDLIGLNIHGTNTDGAPGTHNNYADASGVLKTWVAAGKPVQIVGSEEDIAKMLSAMSDFVNNPGALGLMGLPQILTDLATKSTVTINGDPVPPEAVKKIMDIVRAGEYISQADLAMAMNTFVGNGMSYKAIANQSAQTAFTAINTYHTALGEFFAAENNANIIAEATGTDYQYAAAGGKPRRAGSGASGSANADSGVTGFAKIYGGAGSQASTTSRPGADLGNFGVIAGAGYRVGRELEIGGLFNYSFNNADLYRNFGQVTDSVLRAGIYGNFQYEKFSLTTSPSIAAHILNSERNLGGGQVARGERVGFDISWYNRFAYTFELPKQIFITPSYALGATYFHDPKFTENGNRLASLTYHDYDKWSLLQTLEVRVGKSFNVGSALAVLPEITAGWEHDYLNPNAYRKIESYSSEIVGLAQDRAVLGVGLTALISDKYSLTAAYNERLWDGGHLSQFSVNATAKF